ncbi:hypothetical protein NHX12_024230 [Muraenolepis orangiensis]|uniref:Uncharacterized protein n=1 Tax=Muraenolepis orangiensis TaxID=630683 RepID=A0A9Q0EMB1_9TELE|nr:hypothetical protein NHX12_024230 [Muraenolepis orangiensis]
MVQGEVRWTWLGVSCCLLLWAVRPAEGQSAAGADLYWDWEMGSGGGPPLLQELLHVFPLADSPFVTETPGQPINCSQRFWLPSASEVCWEDVAGPQEFARSRLLVLQNRAALQAVATSSGAEVEQGVSYAQQVREELRGVEGDHQSMEETIGTIQKVFSSLAEKRREGTEQRVFLSVKEHLTSAQDSIHGREHAAERLERQFSNLESSLLNVQHRLNKILMQ